jgi:uncharacterized protein
VILVDTNLLLYATNEAAPEHGVASAWLEEQLNGDERVGLPWESLIAFHRLSTSPRILPRPLAGEAAWQIIGEWLRSPVAWIPQPTDRHAEVFGGLVGRYRPTSKLVPDAHLAAIAIQHGLEICSADSDFARFTEVRWRNPLADH